MEERVLMTEIEHLADELLKKSKQLGLEVSISTTVSEEENALLILIKYSAPKTEDGKYKVIGEKILFADGHITYTVIEKNGITRFVNESNFRDYYLRHKEDICIE